MFACMKQKKNSAGVFVIIIVFSAIFSAPLLYRIYSFVKSQNKFSQYRCIDNLDKTGDVIDAFFSVHNHDPKKGISFVSESYFYTSRWRTRKVLEYTIDQNTSFIGECGKSFSISRLDTDNMADMIRQNESVEIERTDRYFFSKLKGHAEDSMYRIAYTLTKNGYLDKKDTLLQYGALHKSNSAFTYSLNKEPKEFTNGSLYYSGPELLHGILSPGTFIFGKFEIKDAEKNIVECLELKALRHPEVLKQRDRERWFSGMNLLVWIGFGVLFLVPIYFIGMTVKKLVKGEKIE